MAYCCKKCSFETLDETKFRQHKECGCKAFLVCCDTCSRYKENRDFCDDCIQFSQFKWGEI